MTTATIATTHDIVVDCEPTPQGTSTSRTGQEGFLRRALHRAPPPSLIRAATARTPRRRQGRGAPKDRSARAPGLPLRRRALNRAKSGAPRAMPTPAPTPTLAVLHRNADLRASCRRLHGLRKCSPGWRSSTRSRPAHGTAATAPLPVHMTPHRQRGLSDTSGPARTVPPRGRLRLLTTKPRKPLSPNSGVG